MKKREEISLDSLSKDDQIALLKQLLEQSQAQVESLARSYEAQISELQASIESCIARALADQRAEHDGEMDTLKAQISSLFEKIRIMNQRAYGAKSEKVDPNKLSMFNETEANYDPDDLDEPIIEDTPTSEARQKKPRTKPRLIDLSKFEQEVIEHELHGDDCTCGQCGGRMVDYRVEERRVVKIVPARAIVEVHRIHHYLCKACNDRNAAGDEVAGSFKAAKMPHLPIKNSWAHPATIAAVINGKYVNSMPLYRIQADFKTIDSNLIVSRQCLSGWVITSYDRWLSCIHSRLKEKLLADNDLLMADETKIQVLKEPGRTPKQLSYAWLFAAPECADNPIYLFEYHPSRAKSVPATFLKGWSGTLMTDCYAAYYSLDGVQNLSCLVHIRREFLEVVKGIKPECIKGLNSYAQTAVNKLTKMFSIDNEFNDMTTEKRYEARMKKLKPLIDDFEAWLGEHAAKPLPKSKLDKAFKNAIKHWPHVKNVLKDGRFPLENNRSEQAIRPFCVGRRNWLFSDTQAGATASAGIYSIITTARANGLVPMRYIEWLLTELPNAEGLPDPKVLDSFLPWSQKLPDNLYATSKTPKIAADDPIVDIDPHLLDDLPEGF